MAAADTPEIDGERARDRGRDAKRASCAIAVGVRVPACCRYLRYVHMCARKKRSDTVGLRGASPIKRFTGNGERLPQDSRLESRIVWDLFIRRVAVRYTRVAVAVAVAISVRLHM